ncbi:hypothetical protein KQY27_02415 [Methanobrevibacter sp. TMH8]|uniref:hypothetical protein n=1 Tax=Methanobrevibacter sp. TMH8 TaxID=2848611 RepID=UPI001CCB4CE5|nr:hypothetical protein [Methanobrevibacter sp. TMH8]MBZ9570397.1 hypothetical protein [Methanobrevibacter sp. TMH8]
MLSEIMGNCPQVKVVDYLLAHPFNSYTKQQIAVGSNISRSTLDKFINNLIDSEFIIKDNSNKYSLNAKSNIVKMLDNVQNELSIREMEKQAETFDEDIIEYTDEEIDKMFQTDVPDIDLDEVEKEIEENEKISINKKEYEHLKKIKTNNISEKHATYATTTNERNNQNKYNRTRNLFNNRVSYFMKGGVANGR